MRADSAAAESKGAVPEGGKQSKDTPTRFPGAQGRNLSPDLQDVVNAWPSLPDAIRAGIVAMIRAAKGGKK
ncbi:MAG: hypothetical protein JXQ75_21225 [Phycisphaerae bacterium]|nr:hypothetical protein [Phycisphaerae bacterium]